MNEEPIIALGAAAIDFDALPTIDPIDQTATGRRVARFDGDVSELPDRACWSLQHLLTRRYISKDTDAELWSWIVQYRRELAVRLSELDLRLKIADELDIAYVEQADYDSQWQRKLLRREPLNTYDSILALHLAKMMRASRDEHVLISREDIHELFGAIHHDTDRDTAAFDKRINNAIDRLAEIRILVRNRDDEDSFTVSPVINAIMTASMITELQQQFEQLQRATVGAAGPVRLDDDERVDEDARIDEEVGADDD
jgi:Domain of unknown function (DUF4194)